MQLVWGAAGRRVLLVVSPNEREERVAPYPLQHQSALFYLPLSSNP